MLCHQSILNNLLSPVTISTERIGVAASISRVTAFGPYHNVMLYNYSSDCTSQSKSWKDFYNMNINDKAWCNVFNKISYRAWRNVFMEGYYPVSVGRTCIDL